MKVDVQENRVFLHLGNYEFEIVVPPTLAERNPEAAAQATRDLVERQMRQHLHDAVEAHFVAGCAAITPSCFPVED